MCFVNWFQEVWSTSQDWCVSLQGPKQGWFNLLLSISTTKTSSTLSAKSGLLFAVCPYLAFLLLREHSRVKTTPGLSLDSRSGKFCWGPKLCGWKQFWVEYVFAAKWHLILAPVVMEVCLIKWLCPASQKTKKMPFHCVLPSLQKKKKN